MSFFGKDNSADIDVLFDAIAQIKGEIDLIHQEIRSIKPASTIEFTNRVADLEVKISKLWTLLTTTTPQGSDKLSKYGKVFGGKSKGMI